MTDEVVFGVDISRIDADRLASEFIRKDWIEIERALQTGKWFDYRFMNPTAATYLFAHEFTKAYRNAYKRNIDTIRGEFVTPLPADLFKAKARSTISGIWRARQVADAMGMPYDVYLSRAYHWGTRFWQQGHLPRAQQIYSELIKDRVAIDWDEYQRSRFYYSSKPHYMTVNYDERVKAQNDHHEHLFEQIARRGNRAALIAQFIYEDLLPIEKINSRLGPELCQESLALCERVALR